MFQFVVGHKQYHLLHKAEADLMNSSDFDPNPNLFKELLFPFLIVDILLQDEIVMEVNDPSGGWQATFSFQ